jgi:ribosomal protein S18 acetylase RimI-like enzyme
MNSLTTAPYERKYRQDVLSLLFYSRRTHSHLDWYHPGDWLDNGRFLMQMAQGDDEIAGFMGVSLPLNGTSWVRLLAIRQGYDPGALLRMLWSALQHRLHDPGGHLLSVLVVNRWLTAHLPVLGMHYLEDVVTLYRRGTDLPAMPRTPVTIHPAYLEDLDAITRVDHQAFDPPWQMTGYDLRQAQRQAASCTLAKNVDGDVIGYQLSTQHRTTAHLARLAVSPQMQGQRVGAALLHHLIRALNKRGVRSMTVNTQDSNIRSQKLYQRYGFERNGFDLPIWQMTLD